MRSMPGFESGIGGRETCEAVDQQASRYGEHHRQRELRHDQRGVNSRRGSSARRPASGVGKCLVGRVPRAAQRRRGATNQRHDKAHAERERQHARVEANDADPSHRLRQHAPGGMRRSESDRSSQNAGDDGDQRALGEELPRDRPRWRAHRGAHGELLPSSDDV